MNAKEFEKIKVQLIAERERIQAALSGVSHKDKNGTYETVYPDYGDKEDENAAEVTDFSKNKTIEANLEVLLEQANKAIKKIEANTYGVCDNCGNQIPEPRLTAYPSALLCIECQEKADKNG